MAHPDIDSRRTRLDSLTIADAQRLARHLNRVSGLAAGKRRGELERLDSRIAAAERLVEIRRAGVPAQIAYPEDLPIVAKRSELLDVMGSNQVVIVAGETGSGKSTQLPKLCLELGRGVRGRIGHTQPRRIAARSIAERVAEELGTQIGGAVGYKFRFTDEVAERTLVKVMTDGILLNELQSDRRLLQYDTVIVDEAHERSLNIDFLLGYLRRLLPRRPDLSVVVTSATIDTARFSSHFDDAPVVEVSGRAHPVEIRYRPLVGEDGVESRDQTDGITDAVTELSGEGPGDILVFCSGEREIRDATDAIKGLELAHTEVLPLYGRLSSGEQHRVFSHHRGRRIVVATNVAETSLTVPGIRYVVDAGTARISRYSKRTKVQRLPIEAISRASADQRAGRCGRLGPGICIRLYSREDYAARPEFTDPEILRTNLAAVILQMAAIGLGDIAEFPFLEPPDTRTIRDGIALLEELQAVAGEDLGRPEWLTPIGSRLVRIPVDLRLGRMLLSAAESDCLREVLIVASGLAIIDPRERPTGKEAAADELHRRFHDDRSDFITLLNLWAHIARERRARSTGQFRRMCRDEYLNWRRVREWQDIHAQLRAVADGLGLHRNRDPATPEEIHRALLAGLLSHVGSKDPDGFDYRAPRGGRFSIGPGSVLFKRAPQWVMAAELVETTRTWAHQVAPISPEQIEAAGAHLLRSTVSDPVWDPERGAAVCRETVTMLGLTLISGRLVQAHRFDAAAARELLIRHALVRGEWHGEYGFVTRNAAAVDQVLELEARERRRDLLVDEDALVRFFSARVPDDVATVRHFDRWWRSARSEHPRLLDFSRDDLIAADARDVDSEMFPAEWRHGDLVFDLRYEFDPASPTDGVTIDIPASLLDRVEPAVFEWNVPGLREALVAALLKTLPKPLRKLFVPLPDTAAEIAARRGPADGHLLEAVRGELTRRAGKVVMPDDFDLDGVPAHLRPSFRILDEADKPMLVGRDLGELRRRVRASTAEVATAATHPIERMGITEWDFGDLPRSVVLQGAGHHVTAYPALIDDGETVSIRLTATHREQTAAMWGGVRRLVILGLPNPRRLLSSFVTAEARLGLVGGPYDDESEWLEDALAAAVDLSMQAHGGIVWGKEGFRALFDVVRAELAESGAVVIESSARVMTELHELNLVLGELTDERYGPAREDVIDQVGQFVYPGFAAGVGADKLGDVARYIAAARYRLEKLPDHPERDRDLMARVRALEIELDGLMDTLPWRPEMLDVSWMLQELRVSFFAQSIGAKGHVSEKRARAALADLARPRA